MSQHPILDTGSVAYGDVLTGTSNQRFIWADIWIDSNTLRVVNAHLSNMKLRKADIEVVKGHLPADDPDGLKKEVWQIGGRIQRALVQHGQQIDVLTTFADQSPYPVIICADLNETKAQATAMHNWNPFARQFRQAGKGLGGTYPRIGFPLRIDHIFLDPSFEVRSHRVIREKLSDHYPVQVSFSISVNATQIEKIERIGLQAVPFLAVEPQRLVIEKWDQRKLPLGQTVHFPVQTRP